MAKVIAFPGTGPTKFGFQSVTRQKAPKEKNGQLNLFNKGRVVSLHQLSPFDEALLLDERHDPKAKEYFLLAIERKDSVADAYCNLGILESEEKNYTKAIDCFTLSLKEDPRHYESHYNLANIYAEIGNLSLAKVHYQLSIAIEPNFPNSHFNLALTFAMNKEVDEAIQSLYQYKKMVPKEEQALADDLLENLSS